MEMEQQVFWPARQQHVKEPELRAEAGRPVAGPRDNRLGTSGNRVPVGHLYAGGAAGSRHDYPFLAKLGDAKRALGGHRDHLHGLRPYPSGRRRDEHLARGGGHRRGTGNVSEERTACIGALRGCRRIDEVEPRAVAKEKALAPATDGGKPYDSW